MNREYCKTEEYRKKMSLIKKGQVAWNKGLPNCNRGKVFTQEQRNNVSKGVRNSKKFKDAMSLRRKNFDFIEKEYSEDWTDTLRRAIRERDGYICQMPGCNKSQGDRVHSVHHIDYNKKNNNPENLITLCTSCHIKTNYNRKFWINYFKSISILSLVEREANYSID